MATDLDRILELLEKRELGQARARLDLLNPESLGPREVGRYRALEIAHLLGTGHDDVADERLAASLAECASDPEFGFGFGTTLSALSWCSDAERLLRPLAESEGEGAASTLIVGLILVRDGRCEEALEFLHRALSGNTGRDPVGFLIRCKIAECEEALGEPAAAAERYREILHDRPDEHGLWRDLARCERRRGEPGAAAAAAEAMQRYLQVDADDASAWASLGDFQDDAGRPDDAEAAWQRALELDPEDPTVYYNWGVSAGRKKDLDRVRACAESLRSRDPDDPLALALDSIGLEADGDTWRGWEAMRQAVGRESDRDRGLALAHRALLYAERNELVEPAAEFIDELHARNLLDEDVHEVINRIENRRSNRSRDFSVLVDAVPNPSWCTAEHLDAEGVPKVRYVRRMRVVADTGEEARHLAVAFERRCGALHVHVDEVADEGPLEEEDHLGVWWSQETLDCFPAREFESR